MSLDREQESRFVRSLKEVSVEIGEINKRNGFDIRPIEWEAIHRVPSILALVHSEVSEALEAFRNRDRENFKEELADVVIRVLHCSDAFEIDLGTAILEKLEKNRHRGYKHGGKKV